MQTNFKKPLGQYVIKYDPDLSYKVITAAADKPVGSFVTKDGGNADKAEPTSFYGVHVGEGQVFYSLSVLNNHGLIWSKDITEAQKKAAVAALESKNLVLRG